MTSWRALAISLAIAVVALAAGGCAATSDDATDALRSRVQVAVDEFLASRDIPGASVAIVTEGHVLTVVSGHADLERQDPIGPRDEFRLASITKTYLAALALSFDTEGVVALDEPIDPWLSDLPPGLDLRGITMRQLLSHTSGLAQTATDDRDRGKHLTLVDVLARIPPRACAPGRCWSYADGNYVVAALVLESATAKSLTDEMHDRFFEPLELASTHFVGDPRAAPLPPYTLVVDPITFQPVRPHQLRRQQLPIVTDDRAAPIVASATDLARWGDALFNGGAIDPAALDRMLDVSAMRGLPCPHGCPFPYGLGVFHYEFGGREFVGHDGSSGAIVATDVDAGLTIAIVTNGGELDLGLFVETVVAAIDQG